MTGVDERVKGFVENWRETHCAACQALLHDGKFVMIDGRLYCLGCHDEMISESSRQKAESRKQEQSV